MATTHNPRPTEWQPKLRRTRFVCISDTHNCTFKLPKGDVLIHAGDLTNQGTYSELSKTVQWLEKADFEAKIVIAGNHDITLDREFYSQYGMYFHNQRPESPSRCLSLLEDAHSIMYLAHESATVRLSRRDGPRTTFEVFGSPYSPRNGLWAFGYHLGDDAAGEQQQQEEGQLVEEEQEGSSDGARGRGPVGAPARGSGRGGSRRPGEPSGRHLSGPALWSAIPLSADVVVTHTPSRAHRDEAAGRRRAAGCEALRRALWRVRPRLAVCGHVHEGRGAEVVRWDVAAGGNSRFREEGVVMRWEEDPVAVVPSSRKIFRVDLTPDVRGWFAGLDNDGGRGARSGGAGSGTCTGCCGAGGSSSSSTTATTTTSCCSGSTGAGWSSFYDGGCYCCCISATEDTDKGGITEPETGPGVVPASAANPGLGTRGMGGDPERSARCDRPALLGRIGRRETCVVNCAIAANSWPHTGGRRFNKPIVVDLELPVLEDGEEEEGEEE